jgi:hypothetical protein
VPFELNISCKKGMNKTKDRRLKTVNLFAKIRPLTSSPTSEANQTEK